MPTERARRAAQVSGERATMRLLLFSIIAVSCASAARAPDIEGLYVRFLEKVMAKLEDLVERSEAPSKEDRSRVQCIYGINAFLGHVSSSWAISMIDASTKLQSGLLRGNLMDLGQYDECVNVEVKPEDLNRTDGPTFNGQHCLVSVNIHVPNNTMTLNGVPTKLRNIFGVDYIPITMSQCYPSLCETWVLEEVLNSVFSVPDNVLEIFGVHYQVTVSIGEHDCVIKEKEPIDALDWSVAGVVIFIILVTIISTSLDYFYIQVQSRNRPKTYVEEMVVAFSLYTNVGKLLDTRMPSDAMTSLNGMKFFSMAWVVVSHRYRYLPTEPLTNLLDFPDELKKLMKMFLLSGPLAVDSFFMISGLLNTYTFCIMREKNRRYTPLDVINGYIHRFFRLTPAYLMMIGFTASWLYRLRDGPLWYKFVGINRDQCRANYWQNLLYVNNYVHTDTYCMMQSWYLAADMQMFWLSPFVIYPLWRWPIYGIIELVVLTIASILSPMFVSYFEEIKTPIPMTTDLQQSNKEMAMLYLPTHTKTVSYVLGIGAGYLFYKIKKGKIKFEPNLMMRTIGWLVTGGLMMFSIFGGYSTYQLDYQYDRLYSAFYIGFQRFFWSLGLIWIVFTCILGYGGPINTILSWKVFIPLGRLTYCVYLTHIAVILTGIGSVRQSFHYSDFDQVEQFLGDLVMSLMAACVLSLLLESPMMKIEKMIFGGGSPKKRNFSGNGPPRPSAPPDNHTHQA